MSHAYSQKDVYKLIKELTGNQNVVQAPRVFIKMLDRDHNAAVLLNQIIYWSDKTNDPEGWIYKTYKEWDDELLLSQYQISQAVKKLTQFGVETKLKKPPKCNTPKMHYRIDFDIFIPSIIKFLDNPVSSLSNNSDGDYKETSQSDYQETSYSLYTKNTTNTTSKEKGANASLSDNKVTSKSNPSNRYGIQEKVYTPDQQAALDFYRAVAGDGYADNPSNKIEVVEYTSKYGLAWFKAGIKEMQRNRVGLSAWRYFNSIMVNWKAEGRDAEGNPPAKAQPIDFKQAQQQRTSVQEMLASMPEEYRFKREPRVQAF